MIKVVNIANMPVPGYENWAIVRSFKGKSGVQWHPELSPSWDLFNRYLELKDDGVWDEDTFMDEYVPRFLKELASSSEGREALNNLYRADKAGRKVAIGCFCANEALCHRSIVAGLLQGVGADVDCDSDYSRYYSAYKAVVAGIGQDAERAETTGGFREEYWFLSNFYPTPVRFEGFTFACAEAAFQACKCPEQAWRFEGIDGRDAKSLGRRVQMRKDWNDIRLSVMEAVLRVKFSDPTLAAKLKATGKVKLVEHNTWNDKFWGVCNGSGENHLGQLLMKIRAEL